jgi:deoxyadenosine/deoxycytidine kinase
LQKNIRNRGREYEQKIADSYLIKIQAAYFDFFKQLPELRIVVIDVNEVDYVNNTEDYELMKNLVKKPYNKGITHIKATKGGNKKEKSTI